MQCPPNCNAYRNHLGSLLKYRSLDSTLSLWFCNYGAPVFAYLTSSQVLLLLLVWRHIWITMLHWILIFGSYLRVSSIQSNVSWLEAGLQQSHRNSLELMLSLSTPNFTSNQNFLICLEPSPGMMTLPQCSVGTASVLETLTLTNSRGCSFLLQVWGQAWLLVSLSKIPALRIEAGLSSWLYIGLDLEGFTLF